MWKQILVHGSGHKADSWKDTISHLNHKENILCPELSHLLKGEKASYPNLCAAFAEYCDQVGEPIHLCGLSLGGCSGPGLYAGTPGTG